ncbi:MAG: MFS transporter [Nitrospirae bacterium]|nr:MFS transporter [Nitrospirota bacterium]
MADSGKFPALRSREYRLFFFGQIISLSGTWMQSVAQGWLVYSLTKSPFYLGLIAAFGSLPILLFSLFGGIVADRIIKRNLLLLTQSLSIIPAFFLGILTDMNLIKVWHVAFFATFLGTVNAFDIPARQSFIIELVGEKNLMNAIALNSTVFHGARLIGPVIAGIAIAYLGLPACFYLNAMSFTAILFALSKIKVKSNVREKTKGFIKDLIEGIKFVISKSDIYRIILLIAVFSLVGLPYVALLPVFAVEVLKAGPQGFGFLVGATGGGAFLAGLFLSYRGNVENKLQLMSISGICFSLFLLIFSISKSFYLSIIALLFIGWGSVSFFATANSFVQLSVTDELRGRVVSVYAFVFLGFAPIGNYLIGILADTFGVTKAVSLSSIICIIASLLFSVAYIQRIFLRFHESKDT